MRIHTGSKGEFIMFREMRLKDQALSRAEIEDILAKTTHGTLALNGDDGYPYSVPVNFVYSDGKIYFHGISEGYKFDCMSRDDKVSFSVVGMEDVKSDKFTSDFSSVIIFGRVKILKEREEKLQAMYKMVGKFSPDHMEGGRKYAENGCEACGYEITIEHMTGKRAEI